MRLMVIGLDGATFRTLDPWMRAGLMPALSALIARGARVVLHSTTPPVTAPAWVSCFTGVNPGKHGIYNFVHVGRRWGEFVPHSSRDVRVPRLWHRLGRMGYVTHVIDVPLTFPPEPVNGLMVSDLMVSGDLEARTWPEGLRDELRRELGTSFRWAVADRLSVSADYLRHLARSIEEKTRLDQYLIRRYPPDAVFTVLQHTDVLAHYFWHVWDPQHPAHDPKEARRLEPWIRAVVQRVDRAVDRLVALAGDDALIAVVSDHGFGPAAVRVHINDLLLSWGDLRMTRLNRAKLGLSRYGLTPSGIVGTIRRLDRANLLRYLKLRQARQALGLIEAIGPQPELECSRAWFTQSLEPGITLAPAMRENDAYLDGLLTRLRSARPWPGATPYFERVVPRSQVYSGAALEEAPDIVVQLAEGYVATAEITGGPGFSRPRPGQVSGFHRPDGVLILAGPGVREGVTLRQASILDVTPTLLAGLGIEPAGDMDGRCLVEAFEEGLVDSAYPADLQIPEEAILLPGERPVFGAGEEAEILRRLRALGYN